MNKIKIAHIITRMDWGGSPDIVRIICRGMGEDRYDVTLISGVSSNPTAKTKTFLREFKGHFIEVPHLIREINLIRDVLALISLYKIMKQKKFDLVHTHTAKAGMLGRIAAKLAGVKIIVHTSHGHNIYGYFNPILSLMIVYSERFASLFTSKIIALTKLEKDDLIKYKIVRAEKVRVINTAVELPQGRDLDDNERMKKKKELRFEQEGLIIGMVARLEPIKGLDYFIEAAIEICTKYKNVSFVLAEEGSLKERLLARVRAVKLETRILFLGWRDDALEVMAALDILVLASLNEAVGLVLIEAQGMGVPVIATRVGGIPEVVEDNHSGILVKPESIEELVKAMSRLIENDKERKSMAENARLFIQDKFSPDNLIKNINAVYEELL